MTFTVSEDQMTAVLEARGIARRLKAVPLPYDRNTGYIADGRFLIPTRCSSCALRRADPRGDETTCSLPYGVKQRCYRSRKDGLPHYWEETT